ncbi:hypothetical protein FACS1894166_11270 [Bacilli bacterium]|nr:hypothetical protein FACS1894166_11270 [Bacilli bacterium]
MNVNNQVSTGDAGVSTLNLTVQTIKLKTLEIGYTTTLEYLYCDANSLTTLDVSNNPALKSLDCYNSSLTTLDVSKNVNLEYLDISGSNLTTLDVSNNPALKSLYCYGNSLEKLYLPVQNISPVFSIFNNPNLTDIYTKRTSGTQTIYSNQAQSSGKNNASYTIHTLDGIGYPSMFSGTTYAVSGVPITYTVDSTP